MTLANVIQDTHDYIQKKASERIKFFGFFINFFLIF